MYRFSSGLVDSVNVERNHSNVKRLAEKRYLTEFEIGENMYYDKDEENVHLHFSPFLYLKE